METLVKNFNKLTRPIIFDGLKSKTCSPTDVDYVLEYYGKYLILGEVKEKGKDITVGQNIMLTRMADAWNKIPGNVALVVFSQHKAYDEVILLAETAVTKVYRNGKWVDLSNKKLTTKQFLNMFADTYEISHMQNLN
jgi:hypothetical protein